MTNEQYLELIKMLTGITVAAFLSLLVLTLILVLVFGYIYNKKAYLDDLKVENKRKEDFIKKLDRGMLVDINYFTYLKEKERKLNELNSKGD